MNEWMSVSAIKAVIDQKAERHPELARALTWPGLVRICAREDVAIRRSRGPMPRMAQLVPYAGGWTIVLNREAPERRHTYLGAHEIGHLWLHHDRAGAERWERVYNMEQNWPDDPREDDAEIFAALVLMGPRTARPYSVAGTAAETHAQHALRTMRRIPKGPR